MPHITLHDVNSSLFFISLFFFYRRSFWGYIFVNGLFCGSKVRSRKFVGLLREYVVCVRAAIRREKKTNVRVYFIGGCKRRGVVFRAVSVPL